MSQNATPFHLALISMPWALFNRPSIQLGALKTYLEQDKQTRVDCFHPYLHVAKAIGVEQYRELSLNSWAGEALFSSLLFPEKSADATKLYNESLVNTKQVLPQYKHLSTHIDRVCNTWLTATDLSQYNLVGFSICFSQLLPSLFLARQIKKMYPMLPIVFGGSSCSGDIGPSLLKTFSEIDFVVDGEGEEALRKLCLFLADLAPDLPQKVHRRIDTVSTEGPAPIASLDELPFPDYAPFFKEMRQVFPAQPFIPVLPVEFSRGCWWNKCTFCNLNLQWQGYRSKTAERMTAEVLHLSQLHECLSFTFTDNALPPKETDLFLERIVEKDLNLDFFAEIRALSSREKLQRYYQGGLRTVQVGIEALSSSLLKKMAKGTKAIDNMAVMKMCSQHGIKLEGNLITEFPGSTEKEIAETLKNLDYVLPFPALQPATFFLGYGSPIHTENKNFGITSILPHPKNARLFPKHCLQSMTMIVNGYRGDRTKQRLLWKPVKDKIDAWRTFHDKRAGKNNPPLHFRDGGTFLIIRQEGVRDAPLQHRLRGLSRRIYIYCEEPRSITHILNNFPGLGEKPLRTFITDMCSKHLMFQEDNLVLSLAIRRH